MNTYSFSPAKLAFYENSLREICYKQANAWPDDAVDISDQVAKIYMTTEIPAGKKLGSVDGLPAWIDIPPSTREEIIASNEAEKARLRTFADAEIAWRQDALDVGIATEEEVAELTAWKKYRVMLMRVNTGSPQWPKTPEK